MPAWPTANNFPVRPLLGWQETLGSNTIRTSNDVGPHKLRRRSSSTPSEFILPFILTEVQANSLMDFYETSTKGGSLIFTGLEHPRTDDPSAEWRFMEPPSITCTHSNVYAVKLKLELLP